MFSFKTPAYQIARSALSRTAGARHFNTCMTSSGMRGSMRSSSSLLNRPEQLNTEQKRFLNLHEYQSKTLMSKYNVRVQTGEMAENQSQAYEIAKQLKSNGAVDLILKAQIHAGGRGKGHFDNGFKGGVKICDTPEQVRDLSEKMFGANLITHQTGPEGQMCLKTLIHEGIDFDKEFYFAILMDRSHNGPVIVACTEGGMDIEEVAESNPDAIKSVAVDVHEGVTEKHTNMVNELFGFEGEVAKDAAEQVKNLYQLFIETDATQVEINPLVLTKDEKIYCVDAKIGFDANAEFRQKDIFAQRDTSMEDPREVEASKNDLNYVGLDGNIGCMVNGAGLAMGTMDIISLHGASPANFLDVGGSANETQVEEAFKILTADTRVKAILVNIFGGIMKCDTIAAGIVNAATNIGLQIPLVVRLEGTNVEKGVQILETSGLDIISAHDLDDAAKKAVKAIQ